MPSGEGLPSQAASRLWSLQDGALTAEPSCRVCVSWRPGLLTLVYASLSSVFTVETGFLTPTVDSWVGPRLVGSTGGLAILGLDWLVQGGEISYHSPGSGSSQACHPVPLPQAPPQPSQLPGLTQAF